MDIKDNYINIDILVEKVKAHDSQALWCLFEYYQPIVNSCVNQVHNNYKTIEKEDLKSECAFILKHLCEIYDKEKSYFSYYLSNRLQPYLISKVKSKYLEKVDVVSLHSINETELQDSTFNMDYSIPDYTHLHEKINELPSQFKQAIEMVYFQSLTQDQCASDLGITQPAFNKRLKKSLNILKKKL